MLFGDVIKHSIEVPRRVDAERRPADLQYLIAHLRKHALVDQHRPELFVQGATVCVLNCVAYTHRAVVQASSCSSTTPTGSSKAVSATSSATTTRSSSFRHYTAARGGRWRGDLSRLVVARCPRWSTRRAGSRPQSPAGAICVDCRGPGYRAANRRVAGGIALSWATRTACPGSSDRPGR